MNADIYEDGRVDLMDMAMLASWWADDQCQTPAACMGADINRDGVVDIDDLRVFVDQWLY